MNFFRSLLSSDKGSISSTRFVGVFGFIILCASLILTSLIPKEFQPSDVLVDAISNIVMVALFVNSGTNVAALIRKRQIENKES
jgi:hypothetical protein